MQVRQMYPMIATSRLTESRDFWTSLGFEVVFENEFYIHLAWPETQLQLGFLAPNHPTQEPCFHPAFGGEGLFVGLETANADQACLDLRGKGHAPLFDPKDEPWGQRHFAVRDPNGIVVDVIEKTAMTEEYQAAMLRSAV